MRVGAKSLLLQAKELIKLIRLFDLVPVRESHHPTGEEGGKKKLCDILNLCHMCFQEEDLRQTVEESACLQRTYEKYIDLVLVNEDFDITFRKVVEALDALSTEHQWVPVNWVY